MKKQLVKLSLALVAALFTATLCLTVTSCSDDPGKPPVKKLFNKAPVLDLAMALTDGFRYTWKDSDPLADSYELYYVKESIDDPELLQERAQAQETVIAEPQKNGKITIELQDNDFVSLLLKAKKNGYTDIYSEIIKITKIDGSIHLVKTGSSFTTTPVLTVIPVVDGLQCTWTTSIPAAGAYDLYYLERHFTKDELEEFNAAPVNENENEEEAELEESSEPDESGEPDPLVALIKREGTKVSGVTSPYTITPLNSARYYSLVVTATKEGYTDEDSNVQINKMPFFKRPEGGSIKRGVSYSFHEVGDIPQTTASEMDLLGPAVHWFYDGGLAPADDLVATAAKDRALTYFPILTDSSVSLSNEDKETLRNFASSNPDSKYLLAFQANVQPSAIQTRWDGVKSIANELHLKLIAPAVGFDILPEGFNDPIDWLDKFFGLEGNTAYPGVGLSDVDGIAIHFYMDSPATAKTYIDKFKKYNKPIWVTAFCANEQVSSPEWQMKYMSEICTYMELEPRIERYAWVTPKSPEANTQKPYNQLLNHNQPNTLTDLGIVYVNMGTGDKEAPWVTVGQTIKAKDFTACILSDYLTQQGYPSGNLNGEGSSVHLRPGTDSEPETLDVYDFSTNKWLEYQINVPDQNGNYTLLLRNKTTLPTTMTISIDGETEKTATLNSPDWTITPVALGSISKNNHRIRLQVSSGNCELSWLKVEQQ